VRWINILRIYRLRRVNARTRYLGQRNQLHGGGDKNYLEVSTACSVVSDSLHDPHIIKISAIDASRSCVYHPRVTRNLLEYGQELELPNKRDLSEL